MARSLASKPNVIPPGGSYPYGRIRDNDGSGNGTPVNEVVYGDLHQFLSRMMSEAGVTPNNLPDNSTNGFQIYESLLAIIANRMPVVAISIGDWNMDADASKLVNAPSWLLAGKVRGVLSVSIKPDADVFVQSVRDLIVSNSAIQGEVSWGIAVPTDPAVFTVSRVNAGIFDSASYDSTGFNRGFISVLYEI